MADATTIARMITPEASRLGYELVRVRFVGGRTSTLQIMAERADGQMDVDDCAALSRAISALLDETDPVAGEYTLEVSSPGIDRPLTRPRDFVAHVGHEARLEAEPPIDGRRRFKGVIIAADDNGVTLDLGKAGKPVTFAYAAISDAKLVLTDRLIEETLARRQKTTNAPTSQQAAPAPRNS